MNEFLSQNIRLVKIQNFYFENTNSFDNSTKFLHSEWPASKRWRIASGGRWQYEVAGIGQWRRTVDGGGGRRREAASGGG